MEMKCPVCNSEGKVKSVKGEKTITVRNEAVAVETQYYKCSKCGEEFLASSSSNDPFAQAYRLYRLRHRMLQPEEIRAFRRKFDLTQEELAKLLGLGGATLSRYENGSLQDRTHDTLIRMAMEPENLRELVASSTDVFSQEKKDGILKTIDEVSRSKAGILARVIAAAFQQTEADEHSGFKRFDHARFLNAVLYFCKEPVFKTKLNKLLFYADFKHFKEYTVSITGARYARIPFGPAPDGYDLYYPILARQGTIAVGEVVFQDYTGEEYIATQQPDLNVFSESELRVLASVKEHFKNFSASEISDFSHEERGYKKTQTGHPISYRYAEHLKL
jgi:putative zinc finger/helix-turn-helix YgiT family protein